MTIQKYTESYSSSYKIAILIKSSGQIKDAIQKHYIDPLVQRGLDPQDLVSFSLQYNEFDKAPAKLIKSSLVGLMKNIEGFGITTLFVADPNYFKTLTKSRKAEPHYGYVLPCALKGYEHISVILCLNHKALFFNPQLQGKLDIALNTLAEHTNGVHIDLGTDIFITEEYPDSIAEIQQALTWLHEYPELTCDIETFSLIFTEAGIGTISFAWNQHEGVAFLVDYMTTSKHSELVRGMLYTFFCTYEGTLIYHGGTFDIKVLIYNLFMGDTDDYSGLLRGLDVMLKDVEDTMLITYLSTNSTARNKLSLKENAFEYTGNYAQEDIDDITKIEKQDLLRYNLTDAVATWFVLNKHYPTMLHDQQLQVYETITKPSMRVIIQMELTGMPLDMEAVRAVDRKLSTLLYSEENKLQHSHIIIAFEDALRIKEMHDKNATLKKKVKPLNDFVNVNYNPASDKQTRLLLFEFLGLPILDTTDTGLPATGAKTIKKLLNQLKSEYSLTDEDLL